MHLKSLFFAVCFVTLSVVQLQAQNGAGIEDMGLKPFGAYHGGNFDTVSMSNGNLFVKIPLFSVPQRGGQPISYSLYYNTHHEKNYKQSNCNYIPGTIMESGTGLPADPERPCVTTTTWDNATSSRALALPGPNRPGPGGVVLKQDFGFGASQSAPQIYEFWWPMIGGTITRTDVIYFSIQFKDATGSKHVAEEVGQGVWRAFDGTGYFFDRNTGKQFDGNGFYNLGNSDSSGCTYDPNGNCVTATTDTLGQQRPFAVNAPDTSGCPAGPRAVVAATTLTAIGTNGASRIYRFCYVSINVVSSVTRSTDDDPIVNSTSFDYFLQSVILPDLSSWTFDYYDTSGDLKKITLPTGGSISYETTQITLDQPDIQQLPTGASSMTSRTVDANDGSIPQTTHYSYLPTDSSAMITTVTDPVGNDMVTHMGCPPNGTSSVVCTLYPIEVDNYAGPASSNVLLKKVETQYYGVPNVLSQGGGTAGVFPTRITTTLGNGQVSKIEKTYDTGVPFGDPLYDQLPIPGYNTTYPVFKTNAGTGSYGKVLTESEYDFGSGAPGPLVRKTVYTYKALDTSDSSSPAYLASNLLNLPSSTIVYDGSGNVVSQKLYGYDESSVDSSGITMQHNTSLPPGAVRGNLTSVSAWANAGMTATPTCAASGLWIVSKSSYFDTGEVHVATDPCGQSTTYDYSNDYYGAYPTKTTNALGQFATKTYDLNTGSVLVSKDLNLLPTSYLYNDPLDRVTHIAYPDGGYAGFVYGTNSVEIDHSKDPNGPMKTVFTVDGLGRKTGSSTMVDVSTNICTSWQYDASGRLGFASDPFYGSNCGQGTMGTHFNYDALGRKSLEIYADGNYKQWTYTGSSSTITDEAQKSWTETSDALGRLISVVEPGYLNTSYGYTTLDALNLVIQTGHPGLIPSGFSTPEVTKTRTFTYDSLSRLLASTNPETGTICYGVGDGTSAGCHSNGYDANGNLLSKTDARGLITSYTYDALGRLTSKGRAGGSTDSYFYDGQVGQWGATQLLGGNLIGRLSFTQSFNPALAGASCNLAGPKMCDDQYFGYDTMGRMNQLIEASPSEWGSIGHLVGAQFDLAGNMTNLAYPDGRQVAQTFDGAGRLATVTDKTSPNAVTSYISGGVNNSISYTAAGAAQNFTLGNGVTQSNLYNNRLQPCRTMVTTPVLAANINGGNLLDRESFYSQGSLSNCGNEASNNGNIYAIVDNLNVGWTQGFGYDTLNRLMSANRSDGGYNHTYNMDSFGNMIVHDNLHTNPAWSIEPATNRLMLNASPGQLSTDPSQINGYIYDQSGNLIFAAGTAGQADHSYQYDAESREVSVDQGNTALYTYDAGGTRIRKDIAPFNNQAFTEYTYFNGQPIAEKDQNNKWTDYIYANGAKIAKVVSQAPMLHLHGYRDGNDTSCGAEGPVVGSAADGLVIVAGDRFVFDFQQTIPSYGGLAFIFTNGDGTGSMTDTAGTGQPLYFDSESNGAWHHMVGDLSAYVGETVAYPLVGLHSYMPSGTFDMYYANAAVVHKDGSSTPILPAQISSINDLNGTNCGGQNMTAATELTPTMDPAVDTTYYLDDHLGTTQMELSAGGWPLWQGQFTPFGQELADGNTAMHYKFTGKERDAESGLDYFGARYYASSTGRMMSPDWNAKAEPVPYAKLDDPQSLNLYSYVGNNPLSRVDADGHVWDWLRNLGQRIKNSVNYGFITDKQVDARVKQGQDNLRNHGVSPEGLSRVAIAGAAGRFGKTWQTYVKRHPNLEPYSGRTSGTGTPEQNLLRRDANHQMNEKGFGEAELDKSSSNPDAIRGREQQLIDANGGAQSQRGTSSNVNNGIAESNPNRGNYMNAAETEFGTVEAGQAAENTGEVIEVLGVLDEIP